MGRVPPAVICIIVAFVISSERFGPEQPRSRVVVFVVVIVVVDVVPADNSIRTIVIIIDPNGTKFVTPWQFRPNVIIPLG